MRQFISGWLQGNMQNVPSDCQSACDHVYDQVANCGGNTADSNTCSSSANSYSDAIDNIVRCNSEKEAEDGKEGSSKGKNWLVALAEALAGVQSKFLNQAMKDMDKMESESDAATQSAKGGKKDESPEDKEKRQADESKHRDAFLLA